MKKSLYRYFIDWGGNLIWMEVENMNINLFKEIKNVVDSCEGYTTIIKIDDSLKSSIDIFKLDPVKYKISEKLKQSFDPNRIFNPGKMYSGI